MAVHNYRSRQVHETLNGVNPSNGFRDMRSAKSGPNLCQIWQVFGPWASPYGANGQMTMTVHNYRPRQFHRTSNGENPLRGYRDMGSASLAAARPAARPPTHPPARPPGPWRQYPSSPEGWGVKMQPLITCYRLSSWALLVKMLSHRTPLMISHNCFRWWLGAIKQKPLPEPMVTYQLNP